MQLRLPGGRGAGRRRGGGGADRSQPGTERAANPGHDARRRARRLRSAVRRRPRAWQVRDIRDGSRPRPAARLRPFFTPRGLSRAWAWACRCRNPGRRHGRRALSAAMPKAAAPIHAYAAYCLTTCLAADPPRRRRPAVREGLASADRQHHRAAGSSLGRPKAALSRRAVRSPGHRRHRARPAHARPGRPAGARATGCAGADQPGDHAHWPWQLWFCAGAPSRAARRVPRSRWTTSNCSMRCRPPCSHVCARASAWRPTAAPRSGNAARCASVRCWA